MGKEEVCTARQLIAIHRLLEETGYNPQKTQCLLRSRELSRAIKQYAADSEVGSRCLTVSRILKIGPCDGQRTIAATSGVFSTIDPNFVKWGTNKPGLPTQETLIDIYELSDSPYMSIFSFLSANKEDYCFEQDQIIECVSEHADYLSKNHWAHFLFKVGKNFFVAYLGDLAISITRFKRSSIIRAGNCPHVIVPRRAWKNV